MHGTPRALHRRSLATGTAAVVLAGCLTGAALAGPPYTVTVKVVPATAPIPASFKVTASGLSANLSRLKVFLNTAKACAPTAAADAAIAGDVLVISPASGVVHAYTRSKTFSTVAGATGPAAWAVTRRAPISSPGHPRHSRELTPARPTPVG